MKKFRFQLEAVLQWRTQQCDAEEARLMQIVAEREHLLRQQQEWKRLELELGAQLYESEGVEGRDLRQWNAYLIHVRAQQERIVQEIGACEQRIGRQRLAVIEAQRRKHLMERLRERRHTDWEAELNREWEAVSAEGFLARWGR
jgi:flagellar export protein FliJ